MKLNIYPQAHFAQTNLHTLAHQNAKEEHGHSKMQTKKIKV
jgi:hypothetical protein